MASGSPIVSLWVRSEPFSFGSLPVAPHPRLSIHNIKKIVTYAKTKGNLGFPKLSYSVWKHIACNKLQLTDDLAWLYFQTCDLVSSNACDQWPSWDKQFAKCSNPQEIDQCRNAVSVDTLRFVLFLFIQQLHKISLRSSLVVEEWPMRAKSPDLEGRSTPTGSKTMDEHAHLTFVMNHLNDVMELLVEPDSYGGSASVNDLSLTVGAMEALGFLIGGSIDRNRSTKPLHEIALLQQMQTKTGYSKISRTFSFRTLQSWLRSTISQNPYGISSCIASGRRLSWPMAADDKDGRGSEVSHHKTRGKIATNAHFIPRHQVKGNKLIIMSQVCKETVTRSSGTLENSSVKIHRCHYSFIYLLSPMRSVSIEKCRHSTFVLGPVEVALSISQCEHLTIICPTRSFRITGSTLVTVHLMTPTRPVILSGNDSLLLAPYHTHYGPLDQHLAAVSLSPTPNMWDQPLCLGPDHQRELPVWELMSPRDFYIFNIPFNLDGPTKSIPGNLPVKYQKAIGQREKQIDQWQKMVKEAGLSRDQKKQFQGLVETRFQEWLADSGHKRELDGLVVPVKPKPK